MNGTEARHVRKIINSLKQRQYKTFYITLQNAYDQKYIFNYCFLIHDLIKNFFPPRSCSQTIIKQRRYYFYEALKKCFIPGQEKEKCDEFLELFISLLKEEYCKDELSKSYWSNE